MTRATDKYAQYIYPTPCAKPCMFKTRQNDCGYDSVLTDGYRHTKKDCEYGMKQQRELAPKIEKQI